MSRNSASSRAIPVKKRIQQVNDNPYIPFAFGKNQRGMQAGADLDRHDQAYARDLWLDAKDYAVSTAHALSANVGAHKQWANRLLEPFSWHTAIISATEWSNFFALRDNPESQPEIRKTAQDMRRAMDASDPVFVPRDEWHLPLISGEDRDQFAINKTLLTKISVARCARVSYLTHDGVRDPSKDLELYERLLSNGHLSPFEHAAQSLSEPGWHGNFRGWLQHRKQIPGEYDFSIRGSR